MIRKKASAPIPDRDPYGQAHTAARQLRGLTGAPPSLARSR